MKSGGLLPATVASVVALLAVIGLASSPQSSSLQARQMFTATAISACPPRPTPISPPTIVYDETPRPPTPAPTPTPGAPRLVTLIPFPTLVHPLETEEQVLRVVLDIDMHTAEWQDPWCLETPRLQPGRITVQLYASDNAYEGGRPVELGGSDPVWVVTINGPVKVDMLCMSCDGRIRAGGLVYVVNQKTGRLFGTSTLPVR